MAGRLQRTKDCSQVDAIGRLAQAEAFLEVATLTSNETDPEDEYTNVSASLAVLSGIAAADAACCSVLKKRSRSADHRDAAKLVELVEPGGREAAKNLISLINLKDSAQYGVITISLSDLKKAIRQADQIVSFAQQTVRG